MDLSFTAQLATQTGYLTSLRGVRNQAYMDAMIDSDNYDDIVLNSTPLKDAEYGNLLAYLYRRFGQPNRHGDAAKTLTGTWLITTPSPDLILSIEPSLSGAK